MKKIPLLLTLGALIACPVLSHADDNAAPPPPPEAGGPGGHHHHDPMAGLTDAEKAEVKKAHDAAIAADPSLAAEEKANHEAMDAARESGTPPTEADREKGKAFHDKMDAAMIKADPAVAPILEKMKKHHHGPGGPEAGQPANTPAPSGA